MTKMEKQGEDICNWSFTWSYWQIVKISLSRRKSRVLGPSFSRSIVVNINDGRGLAKALVLGGQKKTEISRPNVDASKVKVLDLCQRFLHAQAPIRVSVQRRGPSPGFVESRIR
jgi:hypothetical protein